MSICIPSFNAGKYILETIECLLEQSYRNIEIIVADDGSSDDTYTVLSSIQDSRLKIVHQSNKGAASARNTAYKQSSGDYIKFMDADDLINATCIEIQIKKIAESPGCIASAKWGRFYSPDHADFKMAVENVWRDLPGIDWLVESLIVSGANMMQPGIFLIPRYIVDAAGGWNESLSLIDDFDYMIRIISRSKEVLFCGEALLMYRSGMPNSLSGKQTSIHITSAFTALNLGIENILKIQNNTRSRLACANTYKRWSYIFYPDYMEYYSTIEKNIALLGGANITIVGSKSFNLLSKLTGWKAAKRIKRFLGYHI